MAISTISGIVVGATVSVTLLGSTTLANNYGSVTQHPSFQNILGATQFLDGWGVGDHYFHEVDTNGASVIGPAETHRTIYISGNPATNWTQQEIADAEFGGNTASVTGSYLRDQSFYGGSSTEPLDRAMGATLRGSVSTRPSAKSVWYLLERGYDYDESFWVARGASGHSPLHPHLVGAFGTGTKPTVGYQELSQDGEDNIVIRDVAAAPAAGTFHEPRFYGLTNLKLENVEFTGGMVDIQGCTSATRYRCGMLNSIRIEPVNGATDWKTSSIEESANLNRTSGTFVKLCTSALELENYAYHNGWEDGYDTTNFLFNSGANGQPPTQFSHNFYHQDDNTDTTAIANVSFEPASSHFQFRSGGVFAEQVCINGNIGGNISGGEPGTGEVIGTGNYNLVADNLVMLAQYLVSGNNTLYGAGNWGFDYGGRGQISTLEENLVAHYYNPSDAAEKTAKDAITTSTGTGGALFFNDTEYRDTSLVYNWQANPNSPDQNVGGLNTTILDETTPQKYAENVLGLGDFTARGLALHVISQDYPAQIGREFLNWSRDRFGLEPTVSDRATAQEVNFVPWPHAEGFRWDNRRNWSTSYVPIDGDTVNLLSNDIHTAIHTVELAELNFGQSNTAYIYGGKISAGTVSTGGNGAIVQVSRAGQFHIGGHGTVDLTVNCVNGRFFNKGAVTSGISASAAENAELILATGAGAFTVASGEGLVLTGSKVLCGFDGTDSGTATITFAGTLDMSASDGALPEIREFRSGLNGFTQPNVDSNVVCGGVLNLDLTGLAPGSVHTLITADSVTGTFATVNAANGSGTIAYTATTVTFTLDA